MVLGNFLLLMMINPNDVYQIFMEWTIDAYDWVMVPNVYGMSQFATPMMMSRPYFSSSNYILKMSNYKKDKWCSIIDALYYNFVNKHQNILRKNYSTAYQVILYNKKSSTDKLILKKTAQTYIKQFSKN
jgi:deoxyribodipyrimidine photolyase-related protein